MSASFSVVLSDDRAREVRRLARENDLHEKEVLEQLVDIGLAELEEGEPV
ncbi:CopG family transcriptional regulator [Halovenus sp. WSH3]|uniref:CopG family transcriptional regulator n=1 Tax=Halovenus carboxidivorans TaxID=2692199 RepID=A0A6B0T3F0_9EURY|nr:CopG family transcriptional regulator [Halovenus carboxidivorans]MXR52584.1 CopG family transcriptional regulator [Halovenus carboxidivorans]